MVVLFKDLRIQVFSGLPSRNSEEGNHISDNAGGGTHDEWVHGWPLMELSGCSDEERGNIK